MANLTEQWKNGELDLDECYFAETEEGIYKATGEYLNSSSCINGFDITSILGPVPSYDEWQQLKELLKECKDVLQQSVLSVEEYKILQRIAEVLNEQQT